MTLQLPHLSPQAWDMPTWVRQVATTVNRLITLVGNNPTSGDLKATAATVIPTGWLICDGSEVVRIAYPDLFDVIGTTYGAGDGSTTFNLPDLRDRLLVGAGTISIGANGGADTVELSVDNLPSHNHDLTDPGHTHVFTGAAHNHAVTDPGHAHAVTDPGHTHTDSFVDDAAGTEYLNTGGDKGTVQSAVESATTGLTVDSNTTGLTVDNETATGTNANAETGVTLSATGGGQAFSILPPVTAINWIIKT